MGWGKWAVLIGGGVLAPFTGGASMAIAAPIAAGLDQKEKMDEAKKVQEAATAQAQAAITNAYTGQSSATGGATSSGGAIGGLNTAAQALTPYSQLGNQGANALSTLMGFGGTTPPLTAPAAAAPTGTAMPPSMPSGELGGHQTLASLVTDDNATADMRPSLARAIAARSQNASSYAGPNMQGPDGKFYRVPEEEIEAALAAGGSRLPVGRA